MFKHLEDDEAVVVENGVYRPVPLYERNGGLYAGIKGGFVRIKANGATSHPGVRLDVLYRDGPLWQDRFGRVCVADGEGHRPLALMDDGTLRLTHDAAGNPYPAPKS